MPKVSTIQFYTISHSLWIAVAISIMVVRAYQLLYHHPSLPLSSSLRHTDLPCPPLIIFICGLSHCTAPLECTVILPWSRIRKPAETSTLGSPRGKFALFELHVSALSPCRSPPSCAESSVEGGEGHLDIQMTPSSGLNSLFFHAISLGSNNHRLHVLEREHGLGNTGRIPQAGFPYRDLRNAGLLYLGLRHDIVQSGVQTLQAVHGVTALMLLII